MLVCAVEQKGQLNDDGLVIGNAFANGHILDRSIRHIPDGASSTVFAFECASAWQVGWMAGPTRFVLAQDASPTGHGTVVPVLMCGGEVRLLLSGSTPELFEACLTPDGGEVTPLE